MAWKNEFGRSAARDFEGLDYAVQVRLRRYIRERLALDTDPRRFGKLLRGDKAGLWSYRVGDYRMVCLIEDDRPSILVLRVARRRAVYR